VKFTPQGGTVTIYTVLDVDGCMAINFADTGIGMDEAGIAKALEPFGQADSTLSRMYEGTGLGLPLTKRLMEAHGGTLEIESRLEEGTTVTVRFPANRVIVGPVAEENLSKAGPREKVVTSS
jgi:signal transduction histidine kinase